MENQMQAQAGNVQSEIKTPDQNLDGYFDAFGSAFQRIWKNKILWVWGIFIAVGGGFSSGMGNTSEMTDSEVGQFLTEFWWIIPTVVGLGLLIGIGLWLFSAVVRPGVTRALDRLQNNSKAEVKHQDIWEQGKAKFIEIVKLDVIVFLMGIGIIVSFVIVAIIIALLIGAGMSFSGGVALIIVAVLLGLASFVVFILAIIVVSIIRRIGTVFVSLGDMNWANVIKTSFWLIKDNKMEVFKLILITALIGIIGGIVGAVGLGIISVILITISVLLMGAFMPAGVVLFVVAIVIIFIAFLFLRSFISLWSQDVVVWWVKKMQGVKVSEEKQSENVIEAFQSSEISPQGDLVLENES